MNLDELKAFLAIVEHQSFTLAAEKIHLTQPAISKRIAKLEDSLGVRLFDRISNKVLLTESGQLLLERANELLRDLEDIERAIHNLSGDISGSVRFATSHHIGLHRLPPVFEEFHREYPAVGLDVRFLDSEQACQQVSRGELEFAVVTLPPLVETPLQVRRVWPDPIEIMVSGQHPLAKTGNVISPAELTGHSALLPAVGTYTRALIDRAFTELQLPLHIEINSNYLEVLKMLTAAGLGWSALPRSMLDDKLQVVNVSQLSLQRELGIVTHEKRTLSNAGQLLVKTIIRHGEENP
ncbi:MAG: LysR family transcriptional regulator [Gammaproteobacteria bacterium]|nr:LysR family transcriptional regulator [Gammaproteobacteria bacterium]MAY01489.1 LysR family transcriptional regulator [Gammaproteobacteria bacterium]|tara:strand:+ start:13196 stop:14080 length:885 start_codon:yes stop_codon:yes gene_type:complete